MASNTQYYNLQKPEGSDRVDVSVLNGNMDILDAALKNVSDKANQEVRWTDIVNAPSSMPANDVYQWAKQPQKPTYTYSEVGADASGSAAQALADSKSYTDDVPICRPP